MLSLADTARPSRATQRKRYARIPEVLPIPNLIQLQLDSFRWFIEQGLRELFDEISPIRDFTNRVMELHFQDYEFGEPKYSEAECRTKDMTFSKPLYVNVELHIKETGEIQHQRVYMGDYPWMTDLGTFIINGAERVVVSQLVRSPGVYYTATEDPASGRTLFSAKVIPNRGAWLEFETSNKDLLSVKVDRKRKIAATTLLRAVGYESNDEISGIFPAVDSAPEHQYIATTLEKDLTHTRNEALIEVYKKLRPGDPPTADNARQLVESLFFNFRRYDLGRVGRYKFNKKLDPVAARVGIELPRTERTITREDIAAIVAHLIALDNGGGQADDIDHLGNRRIRANGEPIQNAFLIGSLATYGRINEYGFIETPYRKVKRTVAYDEKELERFELSQHLVAKDGTIVAKAASPVGAPAVAELKKQKARAFPIRPIVTDEIVYLAADEEEEHVIAQANAVLDEQNHFVEERVPARARDQFIVARV